MSRTTVQHYLTRRGKMENPGLSIRAVHYWLHRAEGGTLDEYRVTRYIVNLETAEITLTEVNGWTGSRFLQWLREQATEVQP